MSLIVRTKMTTSDVPFFQIFMNFQIFQISQNFVEICRMYRFLTFDKFPDFLNVLEFLGGCACVLTSSQHPPPPPSWKPPSNWDKNTVSHRNPACHECVRYVSTPQRTHPSQEPCSRSEAMYIYNCIFICTGCLLLFLKY